MKRSRLVLLMVLGLTGIVSFLVCANVFVVSVMHYHFASKTDLNPYIDDSNVVVDTLYARRGYIFDSEGVIVAQDEDTYDIICFLDESRLDVGNVIAYVDDISKTATELAKCLNANPEDLFSIMTNAKMNGLYQTEIGLVGKNISKETKEAIDKLNLPGVEFVETKKRNYTYGPDFSPYLIGFAQQDREGSDKLVGMMGVEQYLNSELTGIDGKRTYQSDKNGYILPGMREEVVPEVDGYDVYLTIDSAIQESLQSSLDDMVSVYKATSAWGGVLDIKTGEILAWGQTPNFDPNLLNVKDYNNYGSQRVYEPGSVFKPFTFAAAIDLGKYDGNKLVDSGDYCYYGDSKNNPHRTYDMDEAYGCISNALDADWGMIPYDYGLIYSSNTVTSTLVSDVITPDQHLEYLNRFHLLEDVNTDGIMENDVSINHYETAEKITPTYGHGVTSTMLRLMQGYTAIFGNGELLKPYYIDKIVDPHTDKVIYEGKRNVVDRPIKESTAKQLQNILERVVSDERGTGSRFAVDGIKVMAKTGTTQVASGGSYDVYGNTIYSAMIGFPYEDPQYMLYFAYEGLYDEYYYTTDEPITRLIKKIALIEHLGADLSHDTIVSGDIHEYEMPQLTNHNFAYAESHLKDYKVNIVNVGNGDKVLDQLPKANEAVYTNQKVFLKTDGDEIVMPDMDGWSRKEALQFFAMAGVEVKFEGTGLVSSQSIAAGTHLTKDGKVTIKLAKPANPNDYY